MSHPYRVIKAYTKEGFYEKRTFIQWLKREPRRLKIFQGDPTLQIMVWNALQNINFPMVQPRDDTLLKDLQNYGKTINYSKPQRYTGFECPPKD